MNLANYNVFEKLKEYYKRNCKPLIFVGEKRLSGNNKCKMYFCDVESEIEIENYKKVFQEYLALYVKNYDMLKTYKRINLSETDAQISDALKYYGENIWKNSVLVNISTPETLGIYGEAINDFYFNIVKDDNILVTYSSKAGYKDRNNKGIDIVGCKMENNNLTLIFSECKFVKSIYKARDGLYGDIVGTETESSHVDKEYINDYTMFIVDHMHSIFSEIENSTKINDILTELNMQITDHKLAIDVFNELNIKIHFSFFAIYSDNKYTPDERKEMFEKIYNAFYEKVELTEINNYDMEIVFIPIKNESTTIKENMRKWD